MVKSQGSGLFGIPGDFTPPSRFIRVLFFTLSSIETKNAQDTVSQLFHVLVPDGDIKLDVRLERESIWLSQKQMSMLFEKNTDTIGLHLRNIYKEGELEESATTEESSVVQQEGNRQVRRKVRFYNLDAIISVGYRVNSKRGTNSASGPRGLAYIKAGRAIRYAIEDLRAFMNQNRVNNQA